MYSEERVFGSSIQGETRAMFKNAKYKPALICLVVATGLVAVQCLSAEEDVVQMFRAW